MGYIVILGRVGIILLLTGIAIWAISTIRFAENISNRLNMSLVTDISIGLVVVGVGLLVIFLMGLCLSGKKQQYSTAIRIFRALPSS